MKVHAALCMAWCFLGTMQFARCGVLQNLGLEEAVREEVGAIMEEAFRGGETFELGLFNAAEDAEAGRPTEYMMEYIALVNNFLKNTAPSMDARSKILNEVAMVDIGDATAEDIAAQLADAGIQGLQPDTEAHIEELVQIVEKHFPNPYKRHELYRSLATIKL